MPPRTCSGVRHVVGVIACAIGLAHPAAGQESRAEQLARQRAEKAADLQVYEPNTAERVLDVMKNFPMLSESPHGPYPLLGGLIEGAGWFKAGVAYRKNFGERSQFLTTHARVSNKGYWQVGGNVEMPDVVRDRLGLRIDASHLHARDVSYYGLGNGSDPGADPAAFKMQATTAGLSGRVRARRHIWLGGRVGYDRTVTGEASIQNPNRSTTVVIGDAPASAAPSTTRTARCSSTSTGANHPAIRGVAVAPGSGPTATRTSTGATRASPGSTSRRRSSFPSCTVTGSSRCEAWSP